jgi:hypothetical protein
MDAKDAVNLHKSRDASEKFFQAINNIWEIVFSK